VFPPYAVKREGELYSAMLNLILSSSNYVFFPGREVLLLLLFPRDYSVS